MSDDVNALAALLTDFNTKIADLESRYEMLKDRIIVTADSFLRTRDNLNKDVTLLKEELRNIKAEIEKGNERIQAVIYELSQFARKEEVKVIEKYAKLWEPLKTVTREDVKDMINDALESHSKEKADEEEETELKESRKKRSYVP